MVDAWDISGGNLEWDTYSKVLYLPMEQPIHTGNYMLAARSYSALFRSIWHQTTVYYVHCSVPQFLTEYKSAPQHFTINAPNNTTTHHDTHHARHTSRTTHTTHDTHHARHRPRTTHTTAHHRQLCAVCRRSLCIRTASAC